MNLNKSANLALWLIFLVLIAPYLINNRYIRKISQIQIIPNKSKEEKRSKDQNEIKLDIASIFMNGSSPCKLTTIS